MANDNFENLYMAEKPKYSRKKVMLLLALVSFIGGIVLFWFTAEEGIKEEIKVTVQENIPENALEAITNIIEKPSGPPVPSNEITVKMGTVPGISTESANSSGAVNSSGDVNSAGAVNSLEPVILADGSVQIDIDPNIDTTVNPSVLLNVAAPVQEDSVVSVQFLDDLAQLMVARYNPIDDSIDLGIKSLNKHYGTSLKGLNYEGQDFFDGREYILRYVFSPSMLSGLYKLYSNKFIKKIVEAAANPKEVKALTEPQLNAMFIAYSKDIFSLSIIMSNISTITDLKSKIADIKKINQQATDMQVKMNEAIFALDEERDSANPSTDKVKKLETEVNSLYAQQSKVSSERLDMQREFAATIRGQSQLNEAEDEMLIYVAYWINRRLETQADALKAVGVAGSLLGDLSRLLKKNGSK